MKSEAIHSNKNCDLDSVEAFLTGEMEQSDEQIFTRHIETCDICQDRLQSQAAEKESWTEAHDFLQPSEFDFETCGPDPTIPLQVRSVLASLAPSEQPEMLGRLGSYEISGSAIP